MLIDEKELDPGYEERKKQQDLYESDPLRKYEQYVEENHIQIPPQELFDFSVFLGMNPEEDLDFLWLAVDAYTADLPEGWTEHYDAKGEAYYYNVATDSSTYCHPLDGHYRKIFRCMRDKKRRQSSQVLPDVDETPSESRVHRRKKDRLHERMEQELHLGDVDQAAERRVKAWEQTMGPGQVSPPGRPHPHVRRHVRAPSTGASPRTSNDDDVDASPSIDRSSRRARQAQGDEDFVSARSTFSARSQISVGGMSFRPAPHDDEASNSDIGSDSESSIGEGGVEGTWAQKRSAAHKEARPSSGRSVRSATHGTGRPSVVVVDEDKEGDVFGEDGAQQPFVGGAHETVEKARVPPPPSFSPPKRRPNVRCRDPSRRTPISSPATSARAVSSYQEPGSSSEVSSSSESESLRHPLASTRSSSSSMRTPGREGTPRSGDTYRGDGDIGSG
eukprot:Rmarinus@m.22472